MIFKRFVLVTATFFYTLICVPIIASEIVPNVTPEDALKKLQDGNSRFQSNEVTHPDSDKARLTETATNGQHPFATVLACSDSRVSLELLFDQGFGDIFVIRIAGNTAGGDEIGSIDYGVGHLGTPLLVVLGHTKCGAVTAAATHAEVEGHVKTLVERISPAVERAKQKSPELSDDQLVPSAITENTWLAVEDLFKQSSEVRHLVSEKKLIVVAAMYDIENGRVTWLGEHPKQQELIANAETDQTIVEQEIIYLPHIPPYQQPKTFRSKLKKLFQ